MKKHSLYLFFSGMLAAALSTGCMNREEPQESEAEAVVPVTVTHIEKGSLTSYLELTASSVFLIKSVMKSPAQAYIEEMKVLPGDPVKKGEVIVVLKTKEAVALQHDSLNPLGFSGLINVTSAINGVITATGHARGDYVSEGDPLATIVIPSSLVFILDVPFESARVIRVPSACDLLLPDGRTVKGMITTRLAFVNEASQTQRFYLVPPAGENLPENLIVQVRIPKSTVKDAVLLDKSCILSDELMQHFWVMKMAGDSIAVKVPVTPGLTSGDKVEILEPKLGDSDLILSSGNYGVGDTIRVAVQNKPGK
jgi:multidrug efflux pump subunit AcrA (membrane-fusion protein)